MNSQSGDQRTGQVASWASLGCIVAVAAVAGGIVGVAMVGVMFWLSGNAWVVDDAGSHGISEQHSSRLGGVAVFFGAAAFYIAFNWVKNTSTPASFLLLFQDAFQAPHLCCALGIAVVGLWDDFATKFSPTARLFLVLAFTWCGFMFEPSLLPASAYEWLPAKLEQSLVLVVAGTLLITGFVNAGNMADGANGLLALVVLAYLLLAYQFGSSDYQLAIIMSLVIFLFFNVATGRIFLGDFGAYGLSAMAGFGSLRLYADGEVSLWLLGCVLAYPCVEMLRVIVSRLMRDSSPLQSANDHVHNFLFQVLCMRGWQPVRANSLTGCVIGLFCAMVPSLLAVSGVIEPGATHIWLSYFTAYVIAHLGVAHYLQREIHAA